MHLLLKRLVWIGLISIVVNFLWEMLQMPFFKFEAWNSLWSWTICFDASLGDTALILGIFIIGILIFRDVSWLAKISVAKVFYLFVLGSLIAIYFEVTALNSNIWEYSDLMPIIPVLDIGLIPYLQMLILPFVAIRLGLCLAEKH